jgi:hypothetical protein
MSESERERERERERDERVEVTFIPPHRKEPLQL